jgi:nitrate reductase NapAB chaperone NapD
MTVLGAVLRMRPEHLPAITARARALPGVALGANPGDGRLVVVIEDATGDDGREPRAAPATLAEFALWPEVLNVSLVYEYSGPDSPAVDSGPSDYRAWRGSLAGPSGA